MIPIVSSSQIIYPQILNDSLIVISPIQLKQTNLIFLQHNKFRKEILYKDSIISNLKLINTNNQKIDSLRINQLNLCTEEIKNNQNTIKSLKTQITKCEKKIKVLKTVSIGSFTLFLGSLLCIFIK